MIRYWNGIFFTVLWTLGMMAWSWPLTTAHAIILAVCGALAGVAFHVVMQRMARRQS
jgi:phosphate/sulfate permease